MSANNQRNDHEVAVIGAGPYGLATAAYLKSARVATCVYGEPMSFWQRHMPERMKLRSPWGASHIAHPEGEYSLEAYAKMRGFAPHEQMAIGEFIRYGLWFQSQVAPDVDTRKVTRVEASGQGFRLRLSDGATVHTQRVVVAMGLAHQEYRPNAFAGLPQALVSHTCNHVSFDAFRGRRVAVVGRGQSACETAALLSESGAEVELVSRGDVLWLGSENRDGSHRSDLAWMLRKLVMTPGAVGPFPLNWMAEVPAFVHLLPQAVRDEFNARCLRAKASGWLRPRFERVRINSGCNIRGVGVSGGQVVLDLDNGTRSFDHVVLGTGYHIDVAKLGIIAPALLSELKMTSGSPHLSHGMESSVPGLHFVGATAVHSFGPLMRFVWGAGFAARAVAHKVLAQQAKRQRVAPHGGIELLSQRSGTVSRL